MTTFLLDANVLIALTVEEHEHHELAMDWLSGVTRVAVCPVVEGALVRFLVRVGESVAAASTVLGLLRRNPRCEFWPDALSYAEADLTQVRGHRQVTDAYLLALVGSHKRARLATLDQALARQSPELTTLLVGRES